VTKRASSESRNATNAAISSGPATPAVVDDRTSAGRPGATTPPRLLKAPSSRPSSPAVARPPGRSCRPRRRRRRRSRRAAVTQRRGQPSRFGRSAPRARRPQQALGSGQSDPPSRPQPRHAPVVCARPQTAKRRSGGTPASPLLALRRLPTNHVYHRLLTYLTRGFKCNLTRRTFGLIRNLVHVTPNRRRRTSSRTNKRSERRTKLPVPRNRSAKTSRLRRFALPAS
jgi:hypothetical protein